MPHPHLAQQALSWTAPDMSSPSLEPRSKGQKPSPHRAEAREGLRLGHLGVSASRAAAHHQTPLQGAGEGPQTGLLAEIPEHAFELKRRQGS